jgi:hypothetical protein
MEKNNNINANRGCYIFIRDEFYICKLKVQNMNLNLVWIIQIGNREKKIKIEKGIGHTWANFILSAQLVSRGPTPQCVHAGVPTHRARCPTGGPPCQYPVALLFFFNCARALRSQILQACLEIRGPGSDSLPTGCIKAGAAISPPASRR